uniref:Protein Jumonji n=1 Tax=Timema monikensis TaxID=170555 RepID=A0A7R9HRD0_9NEOP|nr:unnamed protein product [Timema monikensis]
MLSRAIIRVLFGANRMFLISTNRFTLRCARPVEVNVTVPLTNKESVSLSKEADKNRTNKNIKNKLPGNSSHSAGIKYFKHAHKVASLNTVLSNKSLASHKNVKDSTGGGLGSKRQHTPDKSPEKKSIFHQRRFAHKVKERTDFTPSASAFSPENESSVYAFEMESELPPINTPFRRRARDSRTSSTNTSKSEEDESPPPSIYYAQLDKSVSQSVEVDRTQQMVSSCQVMLGTKPKISPVGSSLCRGSASIAVQVNLDNEPLVEAQPPSFSLLDAGVAEPLPQRSIECSTQTEVTENEEEDDSDGHMFYIPLGGTDTSQSQQLSVAVKLGTEGPTGPNQRVIMSAKLVTKPPCFNRTSTNVQDAKVAGGRRSSLLSQHQRPTGILLMEQKNQFSPSTSSSSTSTSGTYPPVGTVQPTTRARPTITSVASQSKMDATTDTSLVKTTDSEMHHNIEEISSNTQTSVVSKKPCATVTAASKLHSKSGVSVREKRGSSDSQNSVGTVRPSTSKAQQGNVGKLPRGTTDLSSSVSSTAGNNKRGLTKSKVSRSCESVYVGTPVKVLSFPSMGSPAQLVEAPTYHPTEKEFQDPLEYIDKIRPVAEKFGLCRIVPPPNFKPECKVTDDMRFTAYNQYVHKMLHRWGPNVKEMMAIKKYLATQSISLTHPPWVGGMEVDLPRLYQTVQSVGGLKEVIEKKRWQRVADAMKIPKSAQDRVTKLDDIYCKYLLPYDTLSPGERQKLFDDVEKEWAARDVQVLTQDNSGSSDSNEEEVDDIQDESEECIVKGRNMPLNAFYRIARNTMSMWFRQPEPPATEVEQEFWKHVMTRQCHVCVHSGSIDSSGWGYGFPCSKNSPFARHPWNLKVLTNNSGSVLRSMGPIMGVTVPTLHVGMLFTTCCWYRDPHGLPWIEYLHTGASKIWYGIPDEYSCSFRSALEKLVPRYCRDRTIWLPSDTAMVPPSLLVKEGVSLCHTVQEPGQFILVFPRAFTSSVCTGYLVSESVYFAQPNWLTTAEQVFKGVVKTWLPNDVQVLSEYSGGVAGVKALIVGVIMGRNWFI